MQFYSIGQWSNQKSSSHWPATEFNHVLLSTRLSQNFGTDSLGTPPDIYGSSSAALSKAAIQTKKFAELITWPLLP